MANTESTSTSVREKLAPIRNIYEKWNQNLKFVHKPGKNITIDEQLVPYRGRCPFRQYIPSKPAKYGIKIWVLCDSKSWYAHSHKFMLVVIVMPLLNAISDGELFWIWWKDFLTEM